MAMLGRTTTNLLRGANVESVTTQAVRVCVCPCASVGHRADATCRITIMPGEESKMGAAPLEGERGRGCWGSAESNHQMLIGQQAFGSNR